MLHTDKKLRGMTLIEVIVGMTVIILVMTIAVVGVSASANFMQHGTDLRNSEGEAVGNIEYNIKAYKESGDPDVTQIDPDITRIPYEVYIGVTVSDNESVAVSYSEEAVFYGAVSAAEITGIGASEDAEVVYHYYMPPVTTVTK